MANWSNKGEVAIKRPDGGNFRNSPGRSRSLLMIGRGCESRELYLPRYQACMVTMIGIDAERLRLLQF
jgi:hypothetical protein